MTSSRFSLPHRCVTAPAAQSQFILLRCLPQLVLQCLVAFGCFSYTHSRSCAGNNSVRSSYKYQKTHFAIPSKFGGLSSSKKSIANLSRDLARLDMPPNIIVSTLFLFAINAVLLKCLSFHWVRVRSRTTSAPKLVYPWAAEMY